eukprot:scaffold1815_cov147-Skeletonema_dohrnii-CCMP3373.AAC.19
MVARITMYHCNLLVVALLLSSAVAFTGQTGYSTSSCIRQLSSNSCHDNHITRLYVEPSQSDDEKLPLPTSTIDTKSDNTLTTSKYEEGDPRRALEQFGSLFSLVQEIFVEGSSWDEDKLEQKTQEFVRTYLRVFVPGLSYAVTSLGAVSSVEPLRNLLEKADPSWGNAAIALIGCEALGPVILAITLALTPKTMDALQTKLAESGWGEENIEELAAEILNLTS